MVSRRYEDRQLRHFYRRADALLVHSAAQVVELEEFAQVPRERVHIVPHGPYDYGRPSAEKTDLRRRYGLPADKSIALFFGNIRDDKNLDLLIKGWTRFRGEAHLLVAGRGSGSPHKPIAYYKALVERLALNDAVTFADRYVPDNEVADLFAASDWVAIPYCRTFTSQSGVLNVAVCYDRPVLASGAATFAETLGQCDVGVCVPPDDGDALVSGIESLLARLRSGHAHQFERYRQMFSWQENVRRTIEVYRLLEPTESQAISGPAAFQAVNP
jgi:glycosyltransferase involved in cell wall biosynthesis